MLWFAVLGLGIAVGVLLGVIVEGKVRERGTRDGSGGGTSANSGSASDRERWLVEVVEALPLGVVVYDEEGNQVFANTAAADMVKERLHGALILSSVAEVVDGAANGQARQQMLELYGSPRRYLSIRGVPVSTDATGPTAVVVTIEDTTEVRSADLLRRDFVANVSHELKTPVGAIGVLAETLGDVDDPDVASRLTSRLQNESYRLANTVDDLLTLARIESGEQMQVSAVSVKALFAAVADRVSAEIERKGITLDFAIQPDDLVLQVDQVQLSSGLGNLVDNAVKYSERGSTVSITAMATDATVSFTVEDEGVGIPESDLDRIFERFYRVDRGRSRDTGGTGLGLAIVRHVVLNHDGSIDVESEEGVGTSFVMTLPESRRDGASVTNDGPTTVSRVNR